MPRDRRAVKPDTLSCAYPELEKALFDRFWNRRQEGKLVRSNWFRLASRWLFSQIYPDLDKGQFKFSNGWFLRSLSRWGITLRVTTNKAQKVPEDYRDRIVNWLQFNRRNSQPRLLSKIEPQLTIPDGIHEIGRYFRRNICNMDQTPLPFEYLSGRTYAIRGDKTVWAKARKSGWDKRQATIMLAVFADGICRIPPLIIFKGTEDSRRQNVYYKEESKKYDPRVIVWFNQKGYANEQIMLKWFVTYLIPAFNQDERQIIEGAFMSDGKPPHLEGPPNPNLIALDAAKFHKTPAVLQ